jgi:PAS domain S-box-containing protein
MKEELRLQVVKQFERLNLTCHKELQETVAFVAKLCNTPVCSITLIDKDTQWIKVTKGLDIDQTSRSSSFCTHAIKRKGMMEICDTHDSPLFRNHPSVTDGYKVRFYAAAPLITQDGYRIGTLCVMDYKPKTLTKEQRQTFKILAKHAVSVMELKLSIDRLDQSFTELKQEREIRESNEIRLRSMFESLTDSYFLLGKHGEIIDFNRSAYRFVKEKFEEKLMRGRLMTDFLTPAYQQTFLTHFDNAINKGEKVQVERLADYGAKGKVWWDCVFEPIKDETGSVVGVSYVTRNINDRKVNEERILEQNRQLCRIAEIQAHDYRGPVTSILGLMNVIEAEGYIASKEYLLMLQTAVKRLDEKIYEVVNTVNDPNGLIVPV